MKKYITIKHFVLFIVTLSLFSLVGCDIDDIDPIHKLNEDNAIRDPESAQSVLNGIYVQWRQSGVNSIPIELAALGNEGILNNDQDGFNENELQPEVSSLKTIYTMHYKIINQANFLIEKLEEDPPSTIPDEDRNRLIAEGKFNRALAHFNLLRYFGEFYDLSSAYGVVTRTSYASGIEYDARSSAQEVYSLIVDDLEFARENAAEATEHYYAGKIAATALLAKVELYMGNYGMAADLAEEVMNNAQGFSLEDNYADIYTNTFSSSEAIFALYHDEEEGGTEMYKVSSTTYSSQLEEAASQQVDGEGSLEGAGAGYDLRFAYAYSEDTQGANGNGKYPYAIQDQANTMYFIRLAEVYLIYAEAEVRSGGDLDAALVALNTIRSRAQVTPKTLSSPEQLLTDIREEKLLELFFENGEPWFDLIRYHSLGDVDAFAVKSSLHDNYQFIMPIPLDVMIANKNLVQNPGY